MGKDFPTKSRCKKNSIRERRWKSTNINFFSRIL